VHRIDTPRPRVFMSCSHLLQTPLSCHTYKQSQDARMTCRQSQRAATHCHALPHTATCCDTLQHTATLGILDRLSRLHWNSALVLQHTATHCNTLQHLAYSIGCLVSIGTAHWCCNTLQHTATLGILDMLSRLHWNSALVLCCSVSKGRSLRGDFWQQRHTQRDYYTLLWNSALVLWGSFSKGRSVCGALLKKSPTQHERALHNEMNIPFYGKAHLFCGTLFKRVLFVWALLKKSPTQHDQYTLLCNSALVLWCPSAK